MPVANFRLRVQFTFVDGGPISITSSPFRWTLGGGEVTLIAVGIRVGVMTGTAPNVELRAQTLIGSEWIQTLETGNFPPGTNEYIDDDILLVNPMRVVATKSNADNAGIVIIDIFSTTPLVFI